MEIKEIQNIAVIKIFTSVSDYLYMYSPISLFLHVYVLFSVF